MPPQGGHLFGVASHLTGLRSGVTLNLAERDGFSLLKTLSAQKQKAR